MFIFISCESESGIRPPQEENMSLEDYESSYNIIQGEIFDKYCISCHVEGHTYAEESGLILTSDTSYQSLINEYPKNLSGKAEYEKRYKLDNIQTYSVKELEKYSIEADSRVLKNLASEETGSTKFKTYTEPGGTDYTELVFKIKDKNIPIEATYKREKVFVKDGKPINPLSFFPDYSKKSDKLETESNE